jgi:hypothetical protein
MRQRKAIKRAAEIIAECPLGGVCMYLIEGTKEWNKCGHYNGTVRDIKGLRVCCRFGEK